MSIFKKIFKFLPMAALTVCLLFFCACAPTETPNGSSGGGETSTSGNTDGDGEGNEDTPTVDPFANATNLRLMAFNVRIGEKTAERKPAVVKCIQNVNPDVFGVEEADHEWVTYLTNNLSVYRSVGTGRDGGTAGEYTAIFYKTEKYELIQGGTKWLSLTPDTPSILEGGSEYKRIVTYAKLKDRSTGAIFVHMNAHLDYFSDEFAKKQAEIVVEYAQNFKGYPIFITGDLNQEPSSQMYNTFIEAGFIDSSLVADTSHRAFTFNNYGANDASDPQRILDYCFVSPNNVAVSKYDTYNKMATDIGYTGYNGYISDHYAIYVDTKIANTVTPSATANALNNTFFQCGNQTYGDLSFNDYDMGATCSYANKTITFNVPKNQTLTLAGIKTASDVGLRIQGEGKVVFTSSVLTDNFTTSGAVTVAVNGQVITNGMTIGENTALNVDANYIVWDNFTSQTVLDGVDAIRLSGNLTVYGSITVKNRTNTNTGITFLGSAKTLKVDIGSRIKVENFKYAIAAWDGGSFTIDAPAGYLQTNAGLFVGGTQIITFSNVGYMAWQLQV